MEISTSILNSNNRIEDVIKLNRTKTSYIHVDVMDGKFVDDVQFKLNEINAINRVTKYPMDVHLMVNDPISYIVKLKNMNISYITFHLEIRRSKEKIISKIKEMGYKVGISIKPDTDLEKIKPYLKDIDLILIMSVVPGCGGQKFLDGTVERIKEVKKIVVDGGYDVKIEVDGGINNETITKLNEIDIAVVGSYIIKSDNYYSRVDRLINLYNNKNVDLKLEKNNFFVNLLIGIGLFLMMVSAVIGLNGRMEIYAYFYSISKYFLVFLMGFICFSLGMFKKKVCCEENLKKTKMFYRVLLVFGLIPLIFTITVFLKLLIDAEQFFASLLGTFIFCSWYWPVYLIGFLFIVLSIVRLGEIKRLSKK